MLEARGVSLTYGQTQALDGVDICLEPGSSIALMGASGSGKSSLLHCLAGIIVPDAGEVCLDGQIISGWSESQRSRLRLERMGVVFQFGDLVPELTMLENVMLPLQLLGTSRGPARERALAMLDRVGIAHLAQSRISEVSGGEVQRTAVARALVHRPGVVLADEPTGALDSLTAEKVLDVLVDLTHDAGAALLVVTHDTMVASHLDTLVTMHDGRVLNAPAGPLDPRGRRAA